MKYIPYALLFTIAFWGCGPDARAADSLRASAVIESKDGVQTSGSETERAQTAPAGEPRNEYDVLEREDAAAQGDPAVREGGPALTREQELEGQQKANLTRRVRLANYDGIEAVVLELPENSSDGFDRISVDKETALGRAILQNCPDGSMCRLNVIITNGTLNYIFSVQRVKE